MHGVCVLQIGVQCLGDVYFRVQIFMTLHLEPFGRSRYNNIPSLWFETTAATPPSQY